MAENPTALIKELRERTGAGFGDCKAALTEANFNLDEAVTVLRKKGLSAAGKKAGRIAADGLVQASVSGNVGALVEVNCETDFVAKTDEFKAFVKEMADFVAASGTDDVEKLKTMKYTPDTEGHTVAEAISSKIATIGENITLRRAALFPGDASSAFGFYIHANGKIGVLVELKSDKAEAKSAAEAVAREIAMHSAAAEPRFVRREEVTEHDLATEREIAKDQALKSGKPENVVEKIVSGKMEKFYAEAVLLEQAYVRDDKLTITQLLAQKGKEAGAKFDVARFSRFKVGEGIQKRSDDFAAEVAAQAGLK